jgi:hypothetical protein
MAVTIRAVDGTAVPPSMDLPPENPYWGCCGVGVAPSQVYWTYEGDIYYYEGYYYDY